MIAFMVSYKFVPSWNIIGCLEGDILSSVNSESYLSNPLKFSFSLKRLLIVFSKYSFLSDFKFSIVTFSRLISF